MFTSRIERAHFPFAKDGDRSPIYQPDVGEVLGRDAEELVQKTREKDLIVLEGVSTDAISSWSTVSPSDPDHPRNVFHLDFEGDCDVVVMASMGARTDSEFVSAQDHAIAMKRHRTALKITSIERENSTYLKSLDNLYENLGGDLANIDICGPRRLYRSIYLDEKIERQSRALAGNRNIISRLFNRSRREKEFINQTCRNATRQALKDFFESVDNDVKIYRHQWAERPSAVAVNNRLSWNGRDGVWTGLLHRATHDSSLKNAHSLRRAHVRKGKLCTEGQKSILSD